jgi:hypothetical protein
MGIRLAITNQWNESVNFLESALSKQSRPSQLLKTRIRLLRHTIQTTQLLGTPLYASSSNTPTALNDNLSATAQTTKSV